MRVLIANLGSTSFKYRLLDMTDESTLAQGAVDRIGEPISLCKVSIGNWSRQHQASIPDHGSAVETCLTHLTDPDHGCLKNASDVSAIGFKAVHGGRLSGVYRVDEDLFAAMEEMHSVAPAHNPPYVMAMRTLAERVGDIPLLAAFETDFHQTIPKPWRTYAIPVEWTEKLSIRKWGFHGASHRYIADRSSQLLENPEARVISCHLGGSSSLCAIAGGKSVATTMGMSPQTGLPQNNRVGDFDPFALPLIMAHTGKPLEAVLADLATQSGLLGLSGQGADIRDIQQAAANGNTQCQEAIDIYVAETRRHLGGMLVALGGADAICFTAGIGENGTAIRQAVCEGLEELGICLDPVKNENPKTLPGTNGEATIHAETSKTQIWIVPTNEELIVARQCVDLLNGPK